MKRETIAIIGTGIAGMGAGYFLRDRYDVTYYEKNGYAGGHTNTLRVDDEGEEIFIDSAFMVYNEITYPNLKRLFEELDVETKPTDMSFSVQHVPSGLDYCGTGINGLFAQRKSAFSPRFIRMLMDMHRFNQESMEVLDKEKYFSTTLLDYCKEKGFGQDFLNKFLIPMGSAIWSTPGDLMLDFPVQTLVRFFKNHGFLGLTGHYQWRTVVGGSRQYRDKIMTHFQDNMFLGRGVKRIERKAGKVDVHAEGGDVESYDKVILACHADQALSILGDVTELENRLLKEFSYQTNRATLHRDASVMPKTKKAWSSWNYRIQYDDSGDLRTTTIYDMNNLQHVSEKNNYFVSINDPGNIKRSDIIWETDYDHPIYDLAAIRAQKELPKLNGNGTTFFCGSYFKYGFHEDALTSGLEAVKALTGEMPKGYSGLWN